MFKKMIAALSVALAMSACSKKEVKEEGDLSGDLAMQSGAPGMPIPELETVYFAYDSFNLDGATRTALARNAEWLRANPSRAVQVEGHCDERGTEEYNLALGERRAGSVRDYLISQGVSSSQLSTISYGEERPAVMGSDDSSWSRNRRATFVSGN